MKLLKILVLSLFSFHCIGVEYKEFNNPEQEQIYSVLIDELRCLVCQNQTIADSNADLAKDLRRQVHEMLGQGKSKDEIVEFMTQRYGDFVLYNPPFKAKTGLLWIGPVIFLLIGLLVLFLYSRKRRAVKNTSLSEEEAIKLAEKKAKVSQLLRNGEDS